MILVTGGTGLLGSHLLAELTQRGKRVRALKRKNSNTEIVRKTFSYYSDNAEELYQRIDWVEGDVLDIYSLLEAMKDISDVYHCAAMVSFDPADKEMMFRININGTANVVNACLEMNIRKLCHVSSIASLGRAENKGITDENTPWKNSDKTSVYSISKYAGEKEVWRGIEEGLNAVIVNPSVIVGPGDWSKGPSAFFPLVKKGLKFYTTGTNGFVDVKDVVKTMLLLQESSISGERFIISSENLTYKQLFEMISESLHCPPPTIHAGKLISEIGWRLEKIRCALLHKKPLITKETSRTANNFYNYSNQKILHFIPFEYSPIIDTIQHTANIYLNEIHKQF